MTLIQNPILLLAGGVLLLLFLLLGVLWIFRRRSARKQSPKKKSTKRQASKEQKPLAMTADGAEQPAAEAESTPAPAPTAGSEPSPLPLDLESGDKIRILIVDDNSETRDHVSRLLYFEKDIEVIGQATNGRQGIEMAMALKPHIVLMDINMPDMDGITATQEMSIKAPYSQVVIITVQSEPHYIKQAMAAGARDFQPKPFTSKELVSCIRRVYNISLPIYRQIEAARESGVEAAAQSPEAQTFTEENTLVLILFSPKGGIGTTMLAAHLAVAMQQLYGDTVLMDADLQFGDVLVHMNTRPSRTISDIVHQDGIDLELLPDVLLPHNSGLKLLLAPPQPELADAITPTMVADVIGALRRSFRIVLVDTHSKLDDKMLAILDKAGYILFITTPELPAIKSAKQFFDLAHNIDFDLSRIGVAINRANLPGGISPAKIQKLLKLEQVYQIPYDPRLLLAINRGVVLTQQDPNSDLARAVRYMAKDLGHRFLAAPEATVATKIER